MQQDKERNNKSIIWSADDKAEYSFMVKPSATDKETDPPEVEHTIYSYYMERYGITLKYPKVSIFNSQNKICFEITQLFHLITYTLIVDAMYLCRKKGVVSYRVHVSGC